MADNVTSAEAFLHANVSSYWKWTERGQEIAWRDERTIAFLPELAAIVGRVAHEGLPPLGAMVLLLAACRNNWGDAPSRRGLLAGVLEAEKTQEARDLLWQVCDGLDRVNALPADLRQALDAKAELAALVFEDAPGMLSKAASQAVVEALAREGVSDLVQPASSTITPWLTRDLAALRTGLSRVSAEAVQARLKTSLEFVPRPAPVPPPPATGRAWLSELEQDEEFAGIARLAKRLMAVIHVPRKLHDADELPLGGVSDIAPRGSLDRLLLSELAHDDLTLAVRIAMNEALYLRRESPPRTPPRNRRLVLDSGLRLWGLPRLYATAVALALNAHVERHVTMLNYRAAGSELTPVALNTAAGIREHLAALDHRLHPGEALPTLNELSANANDDECLLITSADTFADPAFQAAFDQHRRGVFYVALVARDGRFEVLQCSRAGRKRLSQAHLALEDILQPRPKQARLKVDEQSPLPAYFRCVEPPLLLPVERRAENSWHVPQWGVFTVTSDQRLLLCRNSNRGAQQLADGLCPGMIRGVSLALNDALCVCLVVGKLSPRGLEAIWVSREGEVQSRVSLRPDEGQVDGVTVDRDVAFIRTTQQIQAVDLRTGAAFNPCGRAFDQRFFGTYVTSVKHQGASQRYWFWWRLGTEGNKTVLVPLSPATESLKEPWLRVFEAVGIEGPIAITQSGNICKIGTDETIKVDHGLTGPLEVENVSRDGAEFVLQQGDQRVLVRTSDGAVAHRAMHPYNLESELRTPAPSRTIRRRFAGVGIDGHGNLALVSHKRTVWTLQVPALEFPQQATRDLTFRWQPFEQWEHYDVSGIRLHRATFADGSVAVLDSRGLLHLKSANRSLSECTLVLCEGATAGWCSNGQMWGSSYYCGDRAAMKPQSIAEEVIKPFLERLK